MPQQIIRTTVQHNDGEYRVCAWVRDDAGQVVRYKPADYFTDDKQDALDTARAMLRDSAVQS